VSATVRFMPWLFLLPDCHLHWPAMAWWLMLFMLMRQDGEAAAVMVWCHGTPWCCHDDDSLSFWEKWTTRDDAGRRRTASSSAVFSVWPNLTEISLRFAEILSRYFDISRWGIYVRAWKTMTFDILHVTRKSHANGSPYVWCHLPGYRWSYCLLFLCLKSLLYNWVEKRWIFKA
jgi:hypothetical protein